MEPPRRVVLVRPQTVLAVVGLAAAVVILLLLVYAVRRVLIWALIALFVALALDHVISPLERRIPRLGAVLGVYAAILLLLAGAGYLLVPPLAAQLTDFVNAAPDLLDKLSRGRGPFGFLERKFDIVEHVRAYLEGRGARGAFGLTQPVIAAVGTVLTTVVGLVSIFFLSFFMLLHGRRWRDGVLRRVPADQRSLWQGIFEGVHRSIGRWVIGAAVVALAAGASSTLVLFVLGVPYALALGLVIALLDPLPFVGATAAGAIASLAVLATNGLADALIFVAFVTAYQVIVENHLLVPLVYGRSVELSSLAVLMAVLIGGELAGIVGALVAIPLLGAMKVVAEQLLQWRAARRLDVHPAELSETLTSRSRERPDRVAHR